MKPTEKQEGKVVYIRRYSDHPIVQQKLANVNKILDKADLSFLEKPAAKK